MSIKDIPRQAYMSVTPIETLSNLRRHLGENCPELFIKRDDVNSYYGNKTRKLEYLIADAKQQGADTIVTVGAIQSNHCRICLSAANRENMDCILILEERVKNTYHENASGNNFLYHLLGAKEIHVVPGGTNLQNEMKRLSDKARNNGKKPYIIPGGGSNSIGALGYVRCAEEIKEQNQSLNLGLTHVVAASGSSGTHAGLVAGFQNEIPVTGISVMRSQSEQEEKVLGLAQALSEKLNIPTVKADQVKVDDRFVGPGYSLPKDSTVTAIQTLAQSEGIICDPVYTGKALDGFLTLIREGYFKKSDRVLFLHTGGITSMTGFSSDFNTMKKSPVYNTI